MVDRYASKAKDQSGMPLTLLAAKRPQLLEVRIEPSAIPVTSPTHG
jgi:hypothetical protein